MEAFPPGSDQLLSWESHTLRSTPAASRGYTAQRSEESGREERTPFDITLGSNLIQFGFSYPFTFPCIPISVRHAEVSYSCVISYHKGESSNNHSCTVSLCLLMRTREHSSKLQKRGHELSFTAQCEASWCLLSQVFSVLLLEQQYIHDTTH